MYNKGMEKKLILSNNVIRTYTSGVWTVKQKTPYNKDASKFTQAITDNQISPPFNKEEYPRDLFYIYVILQSNNNLDHSRLGMHTPSQLMWLQQLNAHLRITPFKELRIKSQGLFYQYTML